MSDNYYEKGANHYDHHKELHIDTVNGGDVGKLISAFFKDDAEEAEIVEVKDDSKKVSAEMETPQNDVELIEKLKPIFYNNEDDVKLFLREIAGMQPNNITDLVNRWVEDKRISDYGFSRKGNLWEILKDAGLYTKSRQNWCRRVL